MTISLKHAFTSAKGDGADPTQLQPSHWNADHELTQGANTLLGNFSGSAGDTSEISISSFVQSVLAATSLSDLAALGFIFPSTGDAKLTLKTTADTGWVLMNDGTIGPTSSAATTLANNSAQALYELIWNNVSDTYAPVTSGRGANAAADWAASKPIALTKQLGRALIIGGAGAGLTSRALGQTGGEETHQLVKAEAPSGQLTLNFNDPDHSHELFGATLFDAAGSRPITGGSSASNVCIGGNNSGSGTYVESNPGGTQFIQSSGTGISASLTDHGADTPHNNMQPYAAWNIMIKL